MEKLRIMAMAVVFAALVVSSGGRHAEAQAVKTGTFKGKGGGTVGTKKSKPGKKDKLQAKQFSQEGMSLFKKGDYEAALEYFKKADEIAPSPFITFNIARCLDSLYKYGEAYLAYTKYIESGNKVNVKEAREAIARIEAMPVILKIITSPAGASVLIDDKEVTFQETPIVSEVKGGKKVEVTIRKQGFEDYVTTVEIPFGGEKRIEVSLKPAKEAPAPPKKTVEGEKVEEEEKVEEMEQEEVEKQEPKETVKIEKGAGPAVRMVPISFSFAAGATASTTKELGSYVDASLGLSFLIKEGFVGIALDNLIFGDSYALAVYPAGGYRLKVWKDLSVVFTAGFGVAYLRAFKDGYDEEGAVVVGSGNHWDLAVHADARLCYKVGPVIVQAIPLHANIFLSAGTIDPAPLAQFAFLAGIAYEYP
jgi:hypothetical protein